MIDHEVEFDPDVCELEVYTLNHYDAYLHLLFLFEIFFLMWIIFKIFIEFVTILLLF